MKFVLQMVNGSFNYSLCHSLCLWAENKSNFSSSFFILCCSFSRC